VRSCEEQVGTRPAKTIAATATIEGYVFVTEGHQIRIALPQFVGGEMQGIVIEDFLLPSVAISHHRDANGFERGKGLRRKL
jgi:hypothetical protein